MALKRGLEIHLDSDDSIDIYTLDNDCQPSIMLSPSEDGQWLSVGFTVTPIEDSPAYIPYTDVGMRTFILELSRHIDKL